MMGGFGMGLWWIVGLIVLVVIIWPFAKGSNRGNAGTSQTQKSALDILKERYAKGEIGKEEFEERKRALE